MALNLQDALGGMLGAGSGPRKRRLRVSEARQLLLAEEEERLIDRDQVVQEALLRAQESGIIVIDEIDKVAGKHAGSAGREPEGVQRDLLPIVEGSTVATSTGWCGPTTSLHRLGAFQHRQALGPDPGAARAGSRPGRA